MGLFLYWQLAKDLKIKFPTLKGMSVRNLRYMQKLASEIDNDDFFAALCCKITMVSLTTANDNPTFGILLCKDKKKMLKKYIELFTK